MIRIIKDNKVKDNTNMIILGIVAAVALAGIAFMSNETSRNAVPLLEPSIDSVEGEDITGNVLLSSKSADASRCQQYTNLYKRYTDLANANNIDDSKRNQYLNLAKGYKTLADRYCGKKDEPVAEAIAAPGEESVKIQPTSQSSALSALCQQYKRQLTYYQDLVNRYCKEEAPTQKCTDSDGGIEYNVKGTACEGSKCDIDYCQDSINLAEMDCGWENGIVGSIHNGLGGSNYACPNGCKDGACTKETGNTLDYNKDGTVDKQDVQILQNVIAKTTSANYYPGKTFDVNSDRKINILDVTALELKFTFDYNKDSTVDKQDVQILQNVIATTVSASSYPNGVFDVNSDGKINILDVTALELKFNIATCTDSDGGKDYNIKGQTNGLTSCVDQSKCMTPSTFADICGKDAKVGGTSQTPNALQEYFCDGVYSYVEFFECPNGCQDGACVKFVQCNADVQQCPDGSYVGRDLNDNCEFSCPTLT